MNPFSGGGQVTAEFLLSASTNTGFEKQSLPGTFQHLDSISFEFHSSSSASVDENTPFSDNFALDNIAVTAYDCGTGCTNPLPPAPTVPEPSTFALWGAGLGALLLRRRRNPLRAS
jgi:hypothetical protein